MKEKIKKLLFESSRNSRITTKELGKKTRVSQQSASYLKNQLKKKKLIHSSTIVDGVKLGFINILVGFNFIQTDSITKKEIIEEFKKTDEIIGIEEGKEGVDLLIEYSTLNLSAFNKIHSEIISKFNKKLKTTFVLPVIVNHEYQKNYLSRKFDNTDLILSGDRILRELTKKELKILNELVKFPDKKLIEISDSLNIQIKSVMRIKRLLEKKFVIKGYSLFFDNLKLGIKRQAILLRFTSQEMKQIDKFYLFTKNNKNIIQFTKIIGEFQVLIIAESLKDLGIIKDIRANFPIEKYLIIKSEKIHKKQYLPNLENYFKL